MVKEIDLSKHFLCSKHSKISEEELRSIIEKYNISLKQFPSILLNDPALKGLQIPVGNIVKIERKGPNGASTYYRVVING